MDTRRSRIAGWRRRFRGGRSRKNPIGGRPQAPAVRLRRTAEVTSTGVGICAAGHPRHRRRLRPGGTGAAGNLHTVPLPGLGRGNNGARGHLPTYVDLPDLTKTAPENWTASCVITGHLITALRGQGNSRTADHSACLQEVKTAVRKQSILLVEEALAKTLAGALVQGARRMQRVTKTGAWLTVQTSTVNWTELGAQEWRYALFLR